MILGRELFQLGLYWVQIAACGGNRAFGVNPVTTLFDAVADCPLVNIRPDVIHILHGGASLVL
jgi:hypothetical protein